ncbi:MAG: putative metal-binding motif-containing protein [Sandaracinaceae bacterium]|nr:putative metal-binding motif-containing protein [Sandaracinaceae bacterium]
MLHRTSSRLAALALATALFGTAGTARAFEPFALLIPCRATAPNTVGTVRPCITCHNNPDGGSGCDMSPCFNAFGEAFNANGRVWNAALAMADSDGDGYTNGQELGDPMGTWRPGMTNPRTCACATRPGFAAFTPGDRDGDMDQFCCVGRDANRNGQCLDEGENDGMSHDCDDMNAAANSGAMEICTNSVDNDCDGLLPLFDPDCASIVDRDGDGFCPMGIDLNRDGNCLGAGENTTDSDCDDTNPAVNPAAGENCLDGLDNNCNGLTDGADPMCTSDVDADMDGYCPIGRDLNGNGNCNDPGEATAGFDCNDTEPTVNSAASEICDDGLDNDCNGLVDFRDTAACGGFYDADGDGWCPDGRDLSGSRSCLTPAELAEQGDCDDTSARVNPGAMEDCLSTVDEDCDGLVGLADPDCDIYIDRDGDGFCYVGADMDGDGLCISPGEQSGRGDCDETNPEIRPTAREICDDGVDNNCSGSVDGAERGQCDAYRDIDGDGWCHAGQDRDGDGFCHSEGEPGELSEWTTEEDPFTTEGVLGTEASPVRYPGAPEHCRNMVDEDLDGLVDEAGYCRTDVDADNDGFCPIGTDLNGDGDCDDPGESAGLDCNDSDRTVNSGQMERCREPVDADCDGRVGTRDEDCFYLLDLDGDGVCGIGVDDNGDGDCLDEGEDRFGRDCDERNPMVNSRQREVCDDGIDNDCDGDIDYDDSQCVCMSDDVCDDGNSCTVDACDRESGNCVRTPMPTCGDGGVPIDGGMPMGGEGCSCRASSPARAPTLLLLFGVVALVVVRRRFGR